MWFSMGAPPDALLVGLGDEPVHHDVRQPTRLGVDLLHELSAPLRRERRPADAQMLALDQVPRSLLVLDRDPDDVRLAGGFLSEEDAGTVVRLADLQLAVARWTSIPQNCSMTTVTNVSAPGSAGRSSCRARCGGARRGARSPAREHRRQLVEPGAHRPEAVDEHEVVELFAEPVLPGLLRAERGPDVRARDLPIHRSLGLERRSAVEVDGQGTQPLAVERLVASGSRRRARGRGRRSPGWDGRARGLTGAPPRITRSFPSFVQVRWPGPWTPISLPPCGPRTTAQPSSTGPKSPAGASPRATRSVRASAPTSASTLSSQGPRAVRLAVPTRLRGPQTILEALEQQSVASGPSHRSMALGTSSRSRSRSGANAGSTVRGSRLPTSRARTRAPSTRDSRPPRRAHALRLAGRPRRGGVLPPGDGSRAP